MAKRRKYKWIGFSDEKLLEKRICDLELTLQESRIWPYVEQLYTELEYKGLNFRPHVWISSEWFSPDGVPGIAIPFYTVHDRLLALEKSMMMEAEGGEPEEFMKLLRHEAGHAIDNAFRLRRLKARQRLFGKTSTKYPKSYGATPYDRNFVHHLEGWYAQSHPDEDWAETFSVWLDPSSKWKKRYRGWDAYNKLLFIDELMKSLKGKRQPVRNRYIISSTLELRETLAQHYRRKKRRWKIDEPSVFSGDLFKLFSEKKVGKLPTAAVFLRKNRNEIVDRVSMWTGQYRYLVDPLIDEMVDISKENSLYLSKSVGRTLVDVVAMLTAQITSLLCMGQHRIPM